MPNPVKTKICTQCNETKPMSEFYNDRTTKDGKRGSCKTCFRNAPNVRRENSGYNAEYMKRYRERVAAEERRPGWTEVWSLLALNMGLRSRCDRGKIGAVIVSTANRVVATGYNGPPQHWRPRGGNLTASCKDWCPRANPMGAELAGDYSDCPANHAEINALMHSSRAERECGTIYVTGSMCLACAKAVANSGINTVILVNVDEKADAHRKPDMVRRFLRESKIDVHEARLNE